MTKEEIERYVRPVLDSLATDESGASAMWRAWTALQLSQLLDAAGEPVEPTIRDLVQENFNRRD